MHIASIIFGLNLLNLLSVPASVCGNGLVEAWEECDCGSDETECSTDKCCYPADHPDNACQRKPKAVCRYDLKFQKSDILYLKCFFFVMSISINV